MMHKILIEVVEEETPEKSMCLIAGKYYWLPKSAIRPIIDGVRCIDGKGPVLGECDVPAEIPLALAQSLGLASRPEPALPTQPCRVCSARIMWAKTVNDKPIPIDAEPVEYGGNVVIRGGVAVLLGKDVPSEAGEARYLPHFVTCNRYRRPQVKPKQVNKPKPPQPRPGLFDG